jgi:multidrug resistance efflux pump
MPAGALKLRSDLLFSRQGVAEKNIFVIKDPASGRFFRFGELEHFIAQQLDGKTSPGELQRRVEEKFNAAISDETLERFIERLRGLGLLAGARAAETPRPARRIAGNLFYVRFKAFDPDKFLAALAGKARFLFSPAFVAFSATLIVFAAGLTVLNWPEITREFSNLFRVESLPLAWLVLLAVITLHEFAHGLTCKHFGGQVHELGFLLLYFQPAFYCNVSDAWLFPEKAKRLWVTFAGAYFEMFLWAIATVVWRLTDFATTLNHLALVVVATSAIKTFFNLNPLIKLDGYYLLSDWLEIPNLRQKAFQYLRARARSIFCPGTEWLRQLTPRERGIFLVYGLLAGGYTSWILWWVLTGLGKYLVTRYEAWGFGAFICLLTGLFRQPLRRALARARAAGNEAEAKFKFQHLKKWARALALIGASAAVLYFWPMQLKVSGDFTLLPIRNADVCAEVEGFIVEIPRDEGEVVQQGDVIARLNDRDIRAELDKLANEITANRAKLNLLKAGARPEEIELAKTAVAKAEERLRYAKDLLGMDAALYQQSLLSKREYELSEEQVSVRQKELQEANQQLNLLLAGARPEEIQALEAELNRSETQRRYLGEQLKLLTVTSPVTGVIATHRLKEKLGLRVAKGDLIAAVDELHTITAEIAVSEKDISDAKVGQKVTLKARALPHTSFEGTVTGIAPVATPPSEKNPQEERTVLVMTQLDNPSLLLRPGMSGRAKIYCGGRNGLDLLLRRFVRYFRVEFWSWW